METQTATLTGTVERITYHNEENGFTVAKLQELRKAELTCIVGTMPGIQVGQYVSCTGAWGRHPHHGLQFQVDEYSATTPSDSLGIQRYLESGMIKGIGPVYAKRIVDHFGADTLEVIDKSPHRLEEVEGLGRKRCEKILRSWSEHQAIRNVMLFLQQYGVSPAFAQKIYKAYGEKSVDIVRENPYRLAEEVHGIGFKTADALAAKMGIGKEAPQRIRAGIHYSLGELADDGHVCYPEADFAQVAATILEVPTELVAEQMAAQIREGSLIRETLPHADGTPQWFVWLRSMYLCELGIARELQRLQRAPCRLRAVDTQKALEWAQEKLRIQLAANQSEAVQQALSGKLLVITGGPGTGKSTITKAILAISRKLTSRIVLAAPTGRAAKRMTEITYFRASTIHSLLEFDPIHGSFKRTRENPLDCDLLIVDEASMIDTALMYSLLKATPDGARVIFVGDVNQLPSVGPGIVLRDMIESGRIPVARLTEIFRQAAGSKIITNAHRINQGEFPDIRNAPQSDFFFIEKEEPEALLDTVVELVTQRLPSRYHLDRFQDIQVLTPMKRGIVGCENLNNVLQRKLNPAKEFLTHLGQKYAVGDKVIQLRNNYQKEISNGDIGRIAEIDHEEQTLHVLFDQRLVNYEVSELEELSLAYAISVHKYQGSECPCIVMPIHTVHFKLLFKNLLYTAVTRGKRLVILVGSKKAIGMALSSNQAHERHTGLKNHLQTI